MVKKTDFNSKIIEVENKIPNITGLATNSALTAVENKIPDVSSLVKKTDFDTKVSEIDTPNYLVFQPMYKYFEKFVEGGSAYTFSWESKGLSNEEINSITTSNYNQAPRLVYNNARIKLDFNTDLLKQDRVTYSHGPIVNIYIVYKLGTLINDSGVALENCLFGAVKLTKKY